MTARSPASASISSPVRMAWMRLEIESPPGRAGPGPCARPRAAAWRRRAMAEIERAALPERGQRQQDVAADQIEARRVQTVSKAAAARPICRKFRCKGADHIIAQGRKQHIGVRRLARGAPWPTNPVILASPLLSCMSAQPFRFLRSRFQCAFRKAGPSAARSRSSNSPESSHPGSTICQRSPDCLAIEAKPREQRRHIHRHFHDSRNACRPVQRHDHIERKHAGAGIEAQHVGPLAAFAGGSRPFATMPRRPDRNRWPCRWRRRGGRGHRWRGSPRCPDGARGISASWRTPDSQAPREDAGIIRRERVQISSRRRVSSAISSGVPPDGFPVFPGETNPSRTDPRPARCGGGRPGRGCLIERAHQREGLHLMEFPALGQQVLVADAFENHQSHQKRQCRRDQQCDDEFPLKTQASKLHIGHLTCSARASPEPSFTLPHADMAAGPACLLQSRKPETCDFAEGLCRMTTPGKFHLFPLNGTVPNHEKVPLLRGGSPG